MKASKLAGCLYATDTELEYLRGNSKTDDNECADMFKDYQKCLKARTMHATVLIWMCIAN